MENILQLNKDDEQSFNSGTFEEFENGILSETLNELIIS